ncbi:mechanosensitive ion channel family protein [Sedimenticola thiotaurini]|uniref:Mechanosensitive ion channel protein MscS n=1 Tax=Sedimenticola thiotaurini TaxID=1543721 RepID=A0A0F7JXN3_9GAMM|nr:mechanosensitive ion channel family protein [Sedimenticola thiotaurini]AKH19378.1 mechanosensitive ion channel protein MscS [Sedimenticola thiotaurini]
MWRLLLPILLLLSGLSLPIHSQEAVTGGETPPAKAEPPETLISPRATMETFLHAMNDIKRGDPERIDDAVTALDLTDVSPLVRRERGRDLAWMLLEVMDRTRLIDTQRIPARTTGKPYLFSSYKNGNVQISRMEDGRWLFDRETIGRLPSILDELSTTKRIKGDEGTEYLPWHLRLRQQIPERFKQKYFLLENWQWVGIFIIILVGVVADKLVSLVLRLLVRRWKSRIGSNEFQDLSDEILRPFGMMVMAVIWWIGINLLGLDEASLLVLLVAVKFLASMSGVWAAYRLVDIVSVYLLRRALSTESKLDDALVPLIPRTLKIFVTVIGFVFIADNVNVDISSLLAGLGLGGLAFALAAKDMVQNLFGSVTVLMDRTFTVGDWIIVDKVEGSVERIGFRSTRIRTFYNSLVTVPNSKFITANVDNMGERRYRRLSCKLSLTYDTPPDRIEAFCEGVRELVRQHPYMRKDYYQVYLNEFAASSLDVLLYVFWETPEWNTELRERHRFLLDILRLAKRLGVEFAFPTQTLYMRSEDMPEHSAETLEQQQAQDLGRQEALAVVKESTGLGVKPPPVTFPPA